MELNSTINLKCFCCKNHRAVVRVKYNDNGVEYALCLCDECLALPEDEAVKRSITQ